MKGMVIKATPAMAIGSFSSSDILSVLLKFEEEDSTIVRQFLIRSSPETNPVFPEQ
jgi:hypothetical protein